MTTPSQLMKVPKLSPTSQPTVLPVSVAVAKSRLDYPHDDSSKDDLFAEAIEAAAQQFQHDTGRVPIEQSFVWCLYEFPCESEIRLPVRTVTSISSLKYEDTSDYLRTWSSDNYRLSRDGLTIIREAGVTWPEHNPQPEGVVIEFVAGYEEPSEVPKLWTQGMLLQVGKWFEDREMMWTATEEQFDLAYERIIRRLMRSSYP